MIAQKITVRYYRAVDGYCEKRKYNTFKGAQKFAHEKVGAHPDVSEDSDYAVSNDGSGRITVTGCDITELFPPRS